MEASIGRIGAIRRAEGQKAGCVYPPLSGKSMLATSRIPSPEELADLVEKAAGLGVLLFARDLGKALEQLALFLGELGGRLDPHRDQLVAATVTVGVGDSLFPQPEHAAGLGGGR